MTDEALLWDRVADLRTIPHQALLSRSRASPPSFVVLSGSIQDVDSCWPRQTT